MTPFEDELRKALQRREPSPDFTARLFEKLAAQNLPKAASRFAWLSGGWRQWAAAAVLFLAAGSGVAYREHMQVERGEAAKQQLMVAMRIASTQLRAAQTRVKEIEIPETVIQ